MAEIENLEKFNATILSTTRSMLKLANTEKQKEAIIKRTIQAQEKELKAIKGSTEADERKRQAIRKNISQIQKMGEEFNITTKSVSSFGAAVKKMGTLIGNEAKKTAAGLAQNTKTAIEGDKYFQSFGEASQGLGFGLEKLGKFVDFNSSIFKTLAQNGATFGGSVIKLREAALDAIMPLMQFVDLVGQNSQGLAGLFGTVDQSMPVLTRFTRELRDRTINELAQFGLNLEETAEFGATVLELERARGNADKMRSMDLASITVDYTKNLVKLSKLTGASVQELDQQNRALSVNGAFQAQLAQMAPEEANRLNNMVASLGAVDGNLGQLAQELIALGAPITETSRNLTAMSGGAINDAILAFSRGNGDVESLMNALRASANEAIKTGEGFGDAAFAGGSFGEGLSALAKLAGGQSDALDGEMSARDANTQALVNATDKLQKLEVQAEKAGLAIAEAFITTVPSKIGKMLDDLTTYFTGESNPIQKTIDKMAEIGVHILNWEGFRTVYDSVAKGAKATLEYILPGADDKGIFANVTEDAKAAGSAVKEFATKGEDGKGFFANSKEGVIAGYNYLKSLIPDFNQGTNGFQNFGTGQLAMLHGEEAVVPKANFASALAMLSKEMTATGVPVSQAATETMATTTQPNLIEGINRMVATNEKLADHLNMLVMIGAKTEQNTKKTNINLAKMDGSLV